MYKKFLNARSPLRLLEKGLHGGLGVGNLGVVLAGVRDHHQSKIAEGQGEVAKKLTVIASLVLVPSLIVGYYGQNFESAFDDAFWSISFSSGLILVSTLVQLVLYRWRRWI